MKIFNILFLFLFFSSALISQDKSCPRTANFGKVEICLPTIEGYQECYSEGVVKKIADATEVPANVILGYYLNNEVYEQRARLGELQFDDYFKVYATKQIQDLDANREILEEMKEMLSSSFLKSNWEDAQEEIDKLEFDIEIGAPTIIKELKFNDDSFSQVALVKYKISETESFTVAMSINGLLINKRLIWLAYYANYDGQASINAIEKNTERIVQTILAANE